MMAAYTQLQESDIRRITDSYDLTIIDYEPISAGASSSNYLLWIFLSCGSGLLSWCSSQAEAHVSFSVAATKMMLAVRRTICPQPRLMSLSE